MRIFHFGHDLNQGLQVLCCHDANLLVNFIVRRSKKETGKRKRVNQRTKNWKVVGIQRRDWKREVEAKGSQRSISEKTKRFFLSLVWRKKKQKISLFLPPGHSVKPNQCLFWQRCPSPRLRLTMEENLGRYTSRFQSASCGTGPLQTEKGQQCTWSIQKKSTGGENWISLEKQKQTRFSFFE